MSLLPHGADGAALLLQIRELAVELHRQETKDPDRLSLAVLHKVWLGADRTQLATKTRTSMALLAFTSYMRALGDKCKPPVTDIDGQALITAGVLTVDGLTPAAYSQTQLMDTLYAIRAKWVAACACKGIDQFLAALMHRSAVQASFIHPNSVLDDGRYANDIPNTENCHVKKAHIFDTESFFYDALQQREWVAAAKSAKESVPEVDVAAVKLAASNTLYHCKMEYATQPWFRFHWEREVAPGERDSYRRARPSLADEGRMVIALFRGHELQMDRTCTEEILRSTTDPRSVLTLCCRAWKKGNIVITPSAEAIVRPSLRFLCGELALVDVDGIYMDDPYSILTMFLLRTHAAIDRDVQRREQEKMATLCSVVLSD